VSSPEAVEEGPSLPSPVGASKELETIISKQSTDFNESGNTDSANLASKATGAQSEPELHGEEETLQKNTKKVAAPLKIQKGEILKCFYFSALILTFLLYSTS